MRIRKVSRLLVPAVLACSAASVFGYTPGTYSASFPGQNGPVPATAKFDQDRISDSQCPVSLFFFVFLCGS